MSKELLGTDLKLKEEELGSDLALSSRGDLETVGEELNLGQALIHRLRVRQGELADLGHHRYGSRLYELIGQPNNARTRELAKLYTKECILQDPRIEEIINITVATPKDDRDRLDITIAVQPSGSSAVLNLVFPFYLEVV